MHDEPEAPQQLRHQRRRAGPVHVVIAEDADGLAVQDRARHPRRRHIHIGQRRGVGQQGPQRRRQVMHRLFDADAAQGQQAADDLRQVQPLGDAKAQRPGGLNGARPPQPAASGDALLHAEHGLRRLRQGQRRDERAQGLTLATNALW
jgi:hypothetical protein